VPAGCRPEDRKATEFYAAAAGHPGRFSEGFSLRRSQAFVEQVLIPALRARPDAVVVLDNLGAHKAERVRDALDAARISYRHLPSYSPDLNPIEPCWSKLKGGLRAKAARTLEALEAELGPALATITAQDAQGWFRLCGYGPPK
jgi:transposase